MDRTLTAIPIILAFAVVLGVPLVVAIALSGRARVGRTVEEQKTAQILVDPVPPVRQHFRGRAKVGVVEDQDTGAVVARYLRKRWGMS